MNPLILISAFLGILAMILGIYILHLDRKKPINVLFFIMMILYAHWAFVGVGMLSTENKETFILLYKVSSISFVFVPVTLHIIMLIVKLSRKIMISVLSVIYSTYILLIYFNYHLNLIYKDFINVNGYWNFIRIDPGLPALLNTVIFQVIFIIMLILLIRWYRKTDFLREKKQALILFVSLGLLLLFSFFDYVVFSFISHRDYGLFASYIFVWPMGIGISIIKYRFLSVPPGLYSHDIFENIEECVLVLDHDKKIIFANSNAKKIFLRENAVSDPDRFDQEYDGIIIVADKLLKGLINNCIENIVSINDDKSELAFQVKFSIIKDKYNDRIGVLIIAQQLKGMKEFSAEYNITDREVDVIRNASTGLSNREIAERLIISERTVESHMVNIYNKLKIKNKVELINILKKFSLA
jgi:DNA-binding CsgD family transcriptional regulator